MKRALQRTLGLTIAGLFVGGAVLLPTPAAAEAAPLKFGMDVGAIGPMTTAGVKPDYATMWVGVWTPTSGWAGTDEQLDRMYTGGITPVVHFYYWGNDISQDCLENGCWSSLHNSWKDRAGWQSLAKALAEHLDAHLKGRKAVIVLETEFNKNDVSTSELLDYYLAQKAKFFLDAYSGSQVALGFGNWASDNWGTFDRAAAASTYVGIQGMRASTRDSVSSYTGLVASLLTGSKTLKAKFAKPVFVTDIALSSHWEPDWIRYQASTIKSLMDRRAEFKAAGVVAFMYRGYYDSPSANTADYYGEGERHFGLAWAANKTGKPALKAWVAGIKADRGTTSTATGGLSATFSPTSVGNDWWLETKVSSSSTITKTYVSINGGPWYLLEKTDWGTWARSLNAPNGSSVKFRAFNSAGAYATSASYTWT